MQFLIGLLFVAMFVSSCQRNEPVDLSNNYYPLGMGYEWNYVTIECSPTTHRIIEEKIINGKTYYRNENDYSSFIRSEDNRVYEICDSIEYLFIDFNRAVGYRWDHYKFDRSYEIVSKSETYDTLSNCILISSETDIDYHESVFAPGIGLVRSHLELKNGCVIGGDMTLSSATINGETIEF